MTLNHDELELKEEEYINKLINLYIEFTHQIETKKLKNNGIVTLSEFDMLYSIYINKRNALLKQSISCLNKMILKDNNNS
jgi:hypothetical protein